MCEALQPSVNMFEKIARTKPLLSEKDMAAQVSLAKLRLNNHITSWTMFLHQSGDV